jgi:uncharacterized membrane protein (DUF4010 family)
MIGGLASSTASTMSFSQRSKTENGLEKPFAVAIIISWVIMFIRVIVEIAVVNRSLLPYVWPALVAMGLVALIYAAYLYFSQAAVDEEELSLSNPFNLGPAVKFGLLYALILVIIKTAEIYLGEQGIFATSFLAGLADVDAITLSISDLTRIGGSISLQTGRISIILATLSNTLAKGILVFSLGSKSIRRFVWPIIIVILAIGLGFIFI